MPTPSGTIKFSDIETEFGQTQNQRLGDYRLNGGKILGNLQAPLDLGVPKSVAAGSSSISFDQLRNKRLNIHVDYYSMGTSIDRNDDSSEYDFTEKSFGGDRKDFGYKDIGESESVNADKAEHDKLIEYLELYEKVKLKYVNVFYR